MFILLEKDWKVTVATTEKDRTFLEAPVRVVMTTECYNIDAHKLETLVHGFLGYQRLNITLKGHDGQGYKPREWFNVPLIFVFMCKVQKM